MWKIQMDEVLEENLNVVIENHMNKGK